MQQHPILETLLNNIRSGDVLTLWILDRLGGYTKDLSDSAKSKSWAFGIVDST